jgi:hypothetical protein
MLGLALTNNHQEGEKRWLRLHDPTMPEGSATTGLSSRVTDGQALATQHELLKAVGVEQVFVEKLKWLG